MKGFLRYSALSGMLAAFAFYASTVSAHVTYILDQDELSEHLFRFNISTWLEPLTQGAFYVALGVIVALVAGSIWLFHHSKFFKRHVRYAIKRACSYTSLVPWMLRLSLGILLMAAGIGDYIISPAVLNSVPWISQVQVVIGFLLMVGFLVRPIAIGVLALFLLGLMQSHFVFGNLEVVGLALILLAEGVKDRPGVDDLLGIDVWYEKHLSLSWVLPWQQLVYRLTLGGMLVYSALIEKIASPYAFITMIEKFSWADIFPASWWLWGFGGIELVLGLMIILGLFVRPMAALAFVVLTGTFFLFGESVTSHITIFATLSVLFILGSGACSIDAKYKRHG